MTLEVVVDNLATVTLGASLSHRDEHGNEGSYEDEGEEPMAADAVEEIVEEAVECDRPASCEDSDALPYREEGVGVGLLHSIKGFCYFLNSQGVAFE